MKALIWVAVWAIGFSALCILGGVLLIIGVADPLRAALEPVTGRVMAVILAALVSAVVGIAAAFGIVAACKRIIVA